MVSPSGPEQEHVHHQHDADAEAVVAGIEMALDPVVGRAVAVLVQHILALGVDAVELGALQEHLLDAMGDRAVGVFHGFHRGVVLAMDGGPFAGVHAGGQPQPQAEEMRHHRMQVDGAMRLVTMQVDGDAGDGDLGEYERDEDIAPPRHNHESLQHDAPQLGL